jgi:hypothetical protein
MTPVVKQRSNDSETIEGPLASLNEKEDAYANAIALIRYLDGMTNPGKA